MSRLTPFETSLDLLHEQRAQLRRPAVQPTTLNLRQRLAPLPDDFRPAIALIIDDVGLNAARTRGAIALPVPVTLSFLPYGDHVQSLVIEAHDAGHEIFLHLPMEPLGAQDPGPDVLISDLDWADLAARTLGELNSFEGYTGVNNHMGSRLTQDAGLMAEVMTHISARGLDFVDSLTSERSVAFSVARAHGVRAAKRDVFIDNSSAATEIAAQLAEVVRIARAQGTAIAIAHPHQTSIAALRIWLAELDTLGIDVVSVSEVIRRRNNEGILVASATVRN